MRALLLRLVLLCGLLATAACTLLPTPQEAGAMPLVHDGRAEKGIRRAVVVIPGALASVGIYEPVLDWDVPDTTIMAYRFPGFDGLAMDHRVDIAASGALIADAMERLAVREVYLIGFSTGGPIALEAARRIDNAEVSVALISSAGQFPSAMTASIEGFADVLGALARSRGRTMEDLWLENYRTLLFGRDHFADADQARRSLALAEKQRGFLNLPRTRMTLAHTSDLMTWSLPSRAGLDDVRLGVFHGAEDTVFPLSRTRRFARGLPADELHVYPDQGHLLFVTAPTLFDDIRAFFGLADGR